MIAMATLPMNLPPGGIGGFVGREKGTLLANRLFADAVRFATGRAALVRALTRLGTRRLFVPDWICDSVLEAARHCDCETVRYPLTDSLLPHRVPHPGPREALLLLDAFGLVGPRLMEFFPPAPERCIVDMTQGMYALRPPVGWQFSSARKFVGVADGAFLWGPAPGTQPPPAPPTDTTHLDARAAGDGDAHARFVAYERTLTADELGPSQDSDRVLDRLDHERVARIRHENFSVLHAGLGVINRLSLPKSMPRSLAPIAYPYLPRGNATHELLARDHIWVPRFWPERSNDPRSSDLARTLAQHLLPLPLDQRYGVQEMKYIVDRVRKAETATD